MRGIGAFAALLLLTAPAARGQELSDQDSPGAREAFRMVDAYIISNLQESLGLSDEQFARMIPLVKSLQEARRELVRRRAEVLHRMRRELGSAAPDDAALERMLGELRELTEAQLGELGRAYAAIDAELDTRQRARFRIMEVEVERRIRELMQRARGRNRDRPRPD